MIPRTLLRSINRRFLGDDRPVVFRPHPLALYDGENGAGGGAGAGGQAGVQQGDNGAGSMSILPNAGDNRSAVERASDVARERLASSGSSLPTPVNGQNRNADGTFKQTLPRAGGASADAGAAGGANDDAARAAAEAARAAASSGDGTGEGANEGGDGAGGDGADAEAVAARTVELALADGETAPVEFDDPAIAEKFREALTVADQADAIVQRAEAQIEEVLMVRESVAVDPVGFVLSEVGENPAAVEHLVMSLLTRDGMDELLKKVAKIATDPVERRTVAAEQKAARSEYRDEAVTRVAEARAVSQNLRDVQTVVRAILPSGATDAVREVAYRDMMMDLKAYADRHRLITLNVEDVPMLLNRRLQALGVDPADAAKLANEAINRPPSRASARGVAPNRVKSAATRGNGAPPKPGTPAAPAGKKSGSAFVASAASRKANLVPGSGAGAPGGGSTLTPPRNADGSKMTTAQVVAWHRERLGKGVKSY